jgi:hypothetical protein
MRSLINAAFAAITLAIFTSCAGQPGGLQITSLDTKYGSISTNADGSQSFTTKPIAGAEPVVVGTVVTSQGAVTVNPDGSYTFKSNTPKAVAAVLEKEAVAPVATVIPEK